MALRRELSGLQATALNMIDMVGIGPFVTTSAVAMMMGTMEGALVAWVVGAVFCLIDACIWSELGARMPEAGGTYAFLKESYGGRLGRFMAFLFIWQTTFQAPLVVASGALGIEKYLRYMVPVNVLPDKIFPLALVALIFVLLYRRIGEVGKISVALWTAVMGVMGWIIFGLFVSTPAYANAVAEPAAPVWMSAQWFAALGAASIPTMYSYLGYYNVCHLGAEVRNPARVIPRSMFVSILGIAALYLLMQIAVYAKLPLGAIAASPFVISEYMAHVFGATSASIATGLILFVGVASLFSVVLGYTRIPYAAAKDGLFFRMFAREHPVHAFPHVSLTVLCVIAMVLVSVLTVMDAIKSIVAMRVFTQFVAQAVGLMVLRKREGAAGMPWKMWLYPVPVIVTIAGWIVLFVFNKPVNVNGQLLPLPQIAGIAMPLIGSLMYLLVIRRTQSR